MGGEHLGGDAELALLDARSRRRRSPPRKTSLEPGIAVSRAGDEAARARLGGRERQPALAAGGEDELLDRLVSSARRGTPRAAGEQRRRARRRAPSAPGCDEQVDVDLDSRAQIVASTPLAVAAGSGERLCDRRLGDAVEAEHAPLRRCRPRASRRRSGSLSRAAGQHVLQLARRAGQGDGDAPVELEHERRRRPGEADDERALRDGRLLADTVGEVGVGPPQPVGDGARAALDLGLERRVETQRQAGGRGEQLDGAVVVGRPEPARDDEQIACRARRGAPLRARRRLSPTIRISAGSTPSGEQRRGEVGPVAVASVAADELRAR